jgi:opacity protein-like surface antigen
MRRRLHFALLAAGLLAAAAPASAQRYYDDARPRGIKDRGLASVHLGISSPTGDLGDAFGSGLGFGATLGYGVSRSVLISVAVSHHQFDSDIFTDEEVSVTPITFNGDYVFTTGSRIRPWVGGGIGAYRVNDQIEGFPDEDETTFGFSLGAGVAGPISRGTLLGGGFRYHAVSGDNLPDSEFLTFQIGVGFFL